VKYKTILIDPPWNERGGGKIKRGADRHYPLMRTEEIIETIKNCEMFQPDENCHLFLWVTNNFLKDGLRVIEELGFRYITNIVWVKDRFGLGQYFRGQHELCLFAVKGKLRVKTRTTPTVIFEKRRKHSMKPDGIHRLIEKECHRPFLEMFARERRENWDAWGNEVSNETQTVLK